MSIRENLFYHFTNINNVFLCIYSILKDHFRTSPQLQVPFPSTTQASPLWLDKYHLSESYYRIPQIPAPTA